MTKTGEKFTIRHCTMLTHFNPRIHLSIINQSSLSIKINELKKSTKKIALAMGEKYLPPTTKILDIRLAILDNPKMNQLKKTYQIEKENADVLSFCEQEDCEENKENLPNKTSDDLDTNTSTPTKMTKENTILGSGDIAICPEVVRKNAEYDNISFGYALLEVILHGIWHLCGLEHDYEEKTLKKLHQEQKKILMRTLYNDSQDNLEHFPENFLRNANWKEKK